MSALKVVAGVMSFGVLLFGMLVVMPLLVRSATDLDLPFAVVLLAAIPFAVGTIKLSYVVRGWIDPSFDPALSAHRRF